MSIVILGQGGVGHDHDHVAEHADGLAALVGHAAQGVGVLVL